MSSIAFTLHRRIPLLRRPFHQRDLALAERDRLQLECQRLSSEATRSAEIEAERDRSRAECARLASEAAAARELIERQSEYLDSDPATLQYRQAHFEVHRVVAAGSALPVARAYPRPGEGLSYQERLLGTLPLSTGKGAEIGALNIPLVSKQEANILYVDHLDTEGLRRKYQSVEGIVDIDRPIVNGDLVETLRDDGPLNYVVASHVLEHTANPIRWLREMESVLRPSGRLAIALPDRRSSFDFMRHTSRPADMVAAYLNDVAAPDVRSVYDHHSQASLVNMSWASTDSVLAEEVIAGRGAVQPKVATEAHLAFARQAGEGEYLDVHAWVFTPASFLLLMAQLAADGFLGFRCAQFYPTDPASADRSSSSIIAILERASGAPPAELRHSFLQPLGEA